MRSRATKRFPIAIILNPKNNQERVRGFTHRMIFEGGGFLFLHKDYVADEKRKLRERSKKSKRA